MSSIGKILNYTFNPAFSERARPLTKLEKLVGDAAYVCLSVATLGTLPLYHWASKKGYTATVLKTVSDRFNQIFSRQVKKPAQPTKANTSTERKESQSATEKEEELTETGYVEELDGQSQSEISQQAAGTSEDSQPHIEPATEFKKLSVYAMNPNSPHEFEQVCSYYQHAKVNNLLNVQNECEQFFSRWLMTNMKKFASCVQRLKELNVTGLDLSYFEGSLQSARLEEKHFDMLMGMQLTSLNVSGQENLTDAILAKLLLGNPSLKSLIIVDCENLTLNCLDAIVERTPALENLYVGDNEWMRDVGVAQIQVLPLKSLGLGGCQNLTGECIPYLRPIPLNYLSIAESDWLTDRDVAEIATLPLQKLALEGCNNITSAIVDNLAKMPSLQHLYLAFSWGFNGSDASDLLSKNLNIKSVSYKNGLTAERA